MKALAHLGRGVALLLLVSSTGVMGNAPPDLRLVEAVKTRNPELASRLVKQQVDVNTPEGDGATALHWDDLETADLLVRSGANVNATNDYGVMPLFLAGPPVWPLQSQMTPTPRPHARLASTPPSAGSQPHDRETATSAQR